MLLAFDKLAQRNGQLCGNLERIEERVRSLSLENNKLTVENDKLRSEYFHLYYPMIKMVDRLNEGEISYYSSIANRLSAIAWGSAMILMEAVDKKIRGTEVRICCPWSQNMATDPFCVGVG